MGFQSGGDSLQHSRWMADPARWWLEDPMAPHLHINKPGGQAGEQSGPRNLGLQLQEIKPQTSD